MCGPNVFFADSEFQGHYDRSSDRWLIGQVQNSLEMTFTMSEIQKGKKDKQRQQRNVICDKRDENERKKDLKNN